VAIQGSNGVSYRELFAQAPTPINRVSGRASCRRASSPHWPTYPHRSGVLQGGLLYYNTLPLPVRYVVRTHTLGILQGGWLLCSNRHPSLQDAPYVHSVYLTGRGGYTSGLAVAIAQGDIGNFIALIKVFVPLLYGRAMACDPLLPPCQTRHTYCVGVLQGGARINIT
jgi:hypothetical protein